MKRQITSTRIRLTSNGTVGRQTSEFTENVVQRLRRQISHVQSDGTVVRIEFLKGQQASWCELRGIRTIMLDASHTATEQLGQLEDILKEISDSTDASDSAPESTMTRAA